MQKRWIEHGSLTPLPELVFHGVRALDDHSNPPLETKSRRRVDGTHTHIGLLLDPASPI